MTPLYQAFLDASPNIGSNEQVNNLCKQLDEIRNQPSTLNTNEHCWRSEKKFDNIEWLLKEITDKVFKAVNYYSSKDNVFSDAFKNIDKKQLKIHYWTNINPPGSRNVLHSHKSAIFSGVYYIQGSETGSLRIINPANILGDCNNLSPYTRDFYYDPKDRDLILWPSWLPHEVEVNKSNKERINIAYDIVL
jgi:uncharacterized protein (TIGR02466 family)